MEVNENNDVPVFNAEESAGEGLLNSAGNESEQSVDTTGQQEENKEEEFEVEAFDPKAFMATNSVEEDANDTNTETSTDSDDSDALAWPDLPTDTDIQSTEDTNSDTTAEAQEQTQEQTEERAVELTNDHFKAFTSELGLNADSMDELKEVLSDLVEENRKLKEGSQETVTNKRIDDLKNFLKLDDEQLVRRSLEADGLTGDKLDYAVDRMLDTGMIDVEALKIRNNIDKAIKSESQNVIQAREAEVAKQQKERDEAVESFGKYMQSIDTLFDFKLTGNPDNLPNVRKNHTEYVTSGKYLSEITASEQSLAESSWLWRNREVLKNALINNGRQNGRREILDQIGNPDTGRPQRFTAPSDPGVFDPKKFMQ